MEEMTMITLKFSGLNPGSDPLVVTAVCTRCGRSLATREYVVTDDASFRRAVAEVDEHAVLDASRAQLHRCSEVN